MLYLCTWAEQSFNVVQAVLLAEFDGVVTMDNASGSRPMTIDADGRTDPAAPDAKSEYKLVERS